VASQGQGGLSLRPGRRSLRVGEDGAAGGAALEVSLKVVEERRRRVATPELNRWLRTILASAIHHA